MVCRYERGCCTVFCDVFCGYDLCSTREVPVSSDLAGATICFDASVCWLLYNLTQRQIDECVEIQHDEDSGLRTITVDTRENRAVGSGEVLP